MTDDGESLVAFSAGAHHIPESRWAQRALEEGGRRLAQAEQIGQTGSFEHDLTTGVTTWSRELFRILGVDPHETPDNALFLTGVDAADRPGLITSWRAAVADGISFEVVCRFIQNDAETRWLRIRGLPESAEDGTVVRLVGAVTDDTDRVESDHVRRAAERRFEATFEQSRVGAVIAGLDGLVVRLNAAAGVLLGRRPDDLVGILLAIYLHPEDQPLRQAAMARSAAGQSPHGDERRYIRPDGTIVWASSHVTLIRDEAGEPEYFYAQLQDITERKHLESDLAHQALHDALTGLPNRALLSDRLLQGLASLPRHHSQLGVMFLDIDRFKVINDSLGHTVGDDVLKKTAERIAGAIRQGDTVARFGGDEFVIVCDDTDELEIEEIAERVLHAVGLPCLLGDQEVRVTASIGIAIGNDNNATPESLIRDADAAMYRAKERKGDRIELFDAALGSKMHQRLATVASLRHAIEHEQFVVHYQPVVDLTTGTMVSAEALVRWEHPDRGLLSPAEFIPLAEDTGLIIPIGAWVLEQACHELVEWHDTNPLMSVAVNLSVRQLLVPDIANLVQDILTHAGMPPHTLYLEMTESVLMDDTDYYRKTLTSLKTLGVHLAIDDFGTGYSSLSYLKRFPVDSVKVDRAFVDGLGRDPNDSALVAAILAMAAALGLQVTAEGVETRQQMIHLRSLHCRRAQGYYLARPMPAAALTQLIVDGHRWQLD